MCKYTAPPEELDDGSFLRGAITVHWVPQHPRWYVYVVWNGLLKVGFAVEWRTEDLGLLGKERMS